MEKSHTFEKYASIALDVSINKLLDYGIPQEFLNQIKPGMRVEIPVRGKLSAGYVLNIKDTPEFSPVKPIAKIISSVEFLTPDLFELAIWMSKYYCTPLRQVLKTLIPASIRSNIQPKQQFFVMRNKTREELQEFCISIRNKFPAQAAVLDVMLQVKKGILLTELLEKTQGSRSPVDTLAKNGFLLLDIVRIDRSPLINEHYFQTKPKKLNDDQALALEKISDSLKDRRFETHLLHGITGSGKTEVYLQAIEQALQFNKGTLMLVPEISLTAQTIERFRSRFEGHIAILHHRLSNGERSDEWHRIHRGEAKIVIGARSAVFSPIVNLGLVIVDEEHENSYKQTDEMPCYHARDVAVMRGKMSQASVILGSATPSLESYHNAIQGKYALSKLGNRADTATLPKVKIVDMKSASEKSGGYTNFSDTLIEAIKKRVVAGEQTILFLNRRGYHTTLLCQQCRSAIHCNHCDVALTFHLNENHLACHLCGFNISPPPTVCPSCRSPTMKYRGVGTELIERSLHAILPEVRTLRIDADTTRHKGSHQKLFRAFGTGKADVLIGTQMIAKGLHFPAVTLVGVLNSDSGLNIPDFRASETVFQLITQVAGRSGRGSLTGEVVIQTYLPDNTTIQLAADQNYEGFFQSELESRQLFKYPPFSQLAKIVFTGEDAKAISKLGEQFRLQLLQMLPNMYEVHPILPAGYAKIKDKYRFQFLIRGPSIYVINKALESVGSVIMLPRSIQMRIDINPTSTYF